MTALSVLIALILHAPLAYWLWLDRFAAANEMADTVEDLLFPPWFQWTHSGDPVSWLHHALITAGCAAYGWLWGLLLPVPAMSGALAGAVAAVVAYAVRETLAARDNWRSERPHAWTHPLPHRVGWAVDGIMDVLCPLGVAGWAYALWWILR